MGNRQTHEESEIECCKQFQMEEAITPTRRRGDPSYQEAVQKRSGCWLEGWNHRALGDCWVKPRPMGIGDVSQPEELLQGLNQEMG